MALIWIRVTRDIASNAYRSAFPLLATWSPSATAKADGTAQAASGLLGASSASFSTSSSSCVAFAAYRCSGASPMTTLRPPTLPSGRKRQALPLSPASSELGGSSNCSEGAQPSCSYETDAYVTSHRRQPALLSAAAGAATAARSEPNGADYSAAANATRSTNPQLRRSGDATTPLTAAVSPPPDGTPPPAPITYHRLLSGPSHPTRHQQLQQPAKSAKRRAAEALLAARFCAPPSPSGLHPLHPHAPPHTPHTGTVHAHAYVVGCSLWATASRPPAVAPAAACGCPSHSRSTTAAAAAAAARHLTTSSAAAADSDDYASTDTGVEAPSAPSASAAAAAASAAAAAAAAPNPSHPSQLSGGLALLRERAAALAAAAAQSEAQPPVHSPRQYQYQHQHLEVPPSKRARQTLSAAATTSLGGSSPPQQQRQQQSVATTVPPCDPARGCKAAAAAAATAAVASARAAAAAAAGSSGGGGRGGGGGFMMGSGTGQGQNGAGAGGAGASAAEAPWCGFEVKVPSLNWQAVFDEPPGALQRYTLARGYEKLVLPEGLLTYVVESPRHVEDALLKLKAGMKDRLIAIDLEWRPETTAGRVSPVALLQLSTATVCLVVRTSCMGYGLPPAVADFLADPSLVLLGFGWDSADEAKMRGTFGLGRGSFRRFLDLQEVATSLGYHGFGLARLAQQVLGLPLHKSKAVSRSNWAAPQLTNHQLKYASLDVLVAGQLFRALRLWHSSPSPCASCRNPIGEITNPGPLQCGYPACTSRPATSLLQHKAHCASAGHPPRYGSCSSCGRLHELAATAAAAAAGKERQ